MRTFSCSNAVVNLLKQILFIDSLFFLKFVFDKAFQFVTH